MISTPALPQSPGVAREWTGSRGAFWGILAIVTLWKLFAAGRLGLIFDECYYWEWSLHPSACYFDHPPLTAWLIACGSRIFGHWELAVRIFSVVGGVILAISGRLLGRDLFGEEAGNRSGIFLTLAPIFAGNSLLMTPDSALIPAWSCAALFALRGIRDSRPISPWWFLSGLAAGIGMLSKYTMVLHFLALAVLLTTWSGRRGRIFTGGLISGLVSLTVFSPVMAWNAGHDWVSFTHQIHHGFRNEHACLVNVGNLADYSAFVVVLVSPLLGLFCLVTGIRRLRDRDFLFPAVFYWTILLFFGFAAAKAHIEANWLMPAFVTGLVMLAGNWGSYSSLWRKAALTLLIVADLGGMAALSALMLPGQASGLRSLHPEQFIPGVQPASESLRRQVSRGYADLLSRIEEVRGPKTVAAAIEGRFHASGATFLCLSTYQLTGILAFYAPALEPLLWLPDHGRVRFPWIIDSQWAGQSALIADWPPRGTDYGRFFRHLEVPQPVRVDGIASPLYLSIGEGYRPDCVENR